MTVEHAPDANLIAAAHELLELAYLFKATAKYEIRRKRLDGDDEGARLSAATLCMIEATIAKATGGQ